MNGLSSVFVRVSSLLSGISNALFGQSLAMSRLNVIASYDQSNELFEVCSKLTCSDDICH